MNKKELRARAAEMFDIPADTCGGLTHIEMTENREVFVENHKGILELTDNEVILNTGGRTVKIVGQKLRVLAMNAEEIRLSGQIESVSFGD